MPALPPDANAGLFGKLPSRGDFVRENLPRDFTDAWDAWWERSLAGTSDDGVTTRARKATWS